jgi:hypothetical protein
LVAVYVCCLQLTLDWPRNMNVKVIIFGNDCTYCDICLKCWILVSEKHHGGNHCYAAAC